MQTLTRLALIICLIFSPALFAADKYFGLGIGQSYVDQALFGETGNGFKLFAGYPLNESIAIEVGYVDLGKPEQDLFGIKNEYDIWELGIWIKGRILLNPRYALFAKAGMVYWELEGTKSLFGSPVAVSDDGTDLSWGFGLSIKATDEYSFVLEYEQAEVNLDKAALLSGSVVFRF